MPTLTPKKPKNKAKSRKTKTTAKPKPKIKALPKAKHSHIKRVHHWLKLNKRGFVKKKFIIFIAVFAVIGGGYMAYRSFAYTSLVGADGEYTSLTPARILDTRDGTGGYKTPIAANQSVAVQITGRGGIPASGVKAVVMNVTVTNGTAGSYLTVYPSGESKPTTSNIGFGPGQTISNQVTAKIGADGKLMVYNAVGSAHVIFDVAGYYANAEGTPGSRYSSLEQPSRILDTRTYNGSNAQPVGQNQSVAVQITGRGGIPASGVKAVVMNVTVTNGTAGSYLTVYPSGESKPTTSNIGFGPGQTISNQVTAKIGADGKLMVYNAVGSAHVIFDVAGYYTDDYSLPALRNTQHGRFVAVSPTRILDTRDKTKNIYNSSTPISTATIMDYNATIDKVVSPDKVMALVTNVTVTNGTAGSYLTVYPGGNSKPGTSSINFGPGETISNQVTTGLGNNGAYVLSNAVGSVHAIADLAGYFLEDETVNIESTATASNYQIPDNITKYERDISVNFPYIKYQGYRLGMGYHSLSYQLNGEKKYFTDSLQYITYENDKWIYVSCDISQKCQVPVTGATKSIYGDNQYELYKIPYTLENNKNYHVTHELVANTPNYPGNWMLVSIVNYSGQKTVIYGFNVDKYPLPQISLHKGGSLDLNVSGGKCDGGQNVSASLSNLLINGQPINYTDVWAGNTVSEGPNTLNNCPGISKGVVRTGMSNGVNTKLTVNVNIPPSQRDIDGPTITFGAPALDPKGSGFYLVKVTSTDQKGTVNYMYATSAENSNGYYYDSKDNNGTSTQTMNLYLSQHATHNVVITSDDNSGNSTSTPQTINIP